jgi:hypothetical protein
MTADMYADVESVEADLFDVCALVELSFGVRELYYLVACPVFPCQGEEQLMESQAIIHSQNQKE